MTNTELQNIVDEYNPDYVVIHDDDLYGWGYDKKSAYQMACDEWEYRHGLESHPDFKITGLKLS